MSFEQNVALVTGAASGIGKATALELARRGAAVGVIDIDAGAARSVAAEILAAGGRALAVVADVSDQAAVVAAFDATHEAFGLVQVLVNCAGILRLKPAIEVDVSEFDLVMSVNARSVFLTSTEFARRVIAAGEGGSIVNVSSVHAVISEPNAAAYTASKGAIEAMSRTFASEWASRGIRVNSVRPGAIWTPLSTPLYTPEVLRALTQRVPMAHPGEPIHVARGICFLASPDAAYVTGTTLDIDGGFIMDGSPPGTVYS